MAAVRANCIIHSDTGLVAGSVLIGILASTLALWLAFSPRGTWLTPPATSVVGLAVFSKHFIAMTGAAFLPTEVVVAYAAPALNPHLLAIVVAVAAFLIIGFITLIALPDAHYTGGHDDAGTYFRSYSLSDLESRPDPARFLRVHRSQSDRCVTFAGRPQHRRDHTAGNRTVDPGGSR